MDKNFRPWSRSMQPQNLSVSMAGTPGTPMVVFLHGLSSSGELRCRDTAGGGPVVSTNGRTGGPGLATALPCLKMSNLPAAKEMFTHVHHAHMLLKQVRPVHWTKCVLKNWLDVVILPSRESAQRVRPHLGPPRSIPDQSTQPYLLSTHPKPYKLLHHIWKLYLADMCNLRSAGKF